MSAEIDKLSPEDREILLRTPSIVALLAAVSDDGIVSENERTDAIKLAHFRTYTSREILRNFYKHVDPVFEKYFDEEMALLPEGWEAKEAHIENRLTDLNKVLPKLDTVYAQELVESLKSFSKHVFKSNSNLLNYFVLPVFMNKIEKESFNPKIGE